MKTKTLLICTSLLFTLGCGASRESAYEAAAAPAAATSDGGLVAQADTLWGDRVDGAKLREALATYEKAVAADPSNRHALERLALGYYLVGNGFPEGDEQGLEAYHKGASWAERILGLREAFRTRVAAGEDDYKALDALTKEDVPGIYWAYANLGKWSVGKGFGTVLKYKSKLKAFIDRVAELSPDYYFGAADRGLGAFYAKAPGFAGGDLGKAKVHFEKSLTIEPNYIGTKVLMARYYAVKQQDRPLFEKLLKEAIATDPNTIPDAIAMQQIELANAKKLLTEADDLFE